MAIMVDQVDEVLNNETLRELESQHSDCNVDKSYIHRVAKSGESAQLVLDIDRGLTTAELVRSENVAY